MKPADLKYIELPYPASDYFPKEKLRKVDIERFHRQEWIPIEYVRVYLRVSLRQMINILEYGYKVSGNYIRIETDRDEEKEYYHNRQAFPDECEPFFAGVKDFSQINIHISSWEKILEARGEDIFYPHLTDECDASSQEEPKPQFGAQLSETQKEIEKEKDRRIAQLEKELAIAKADPGTTVNAAKWEGSVAAAFTLWAEIIVGNKTDWKEHEFRTELANKYSDYHTKVHFLAWSLLPSTFKHGVGRSKKPPEKSQQPDNS